MNELDELLEVVDEENNLTGIIEKRTYIHEVGIRHREAVCWIINSNGEVLVQKRALSKKHAPGKWDLTAGHIKAGEDIEEAMVREIEEEIGIKAKKHELKLLCVIKRDGITTNNNAFQYNYLYKTDKAINEYKINEEEVCDIQYISMDMVKQIVKQKDNKYAFSNRDYTCDIIELIKDKYMNH